MKLKTPDLASAIIQKHRFQSILLWTGKRIFRLGHYLNNYRVFTLTAGSPDIKQPTVFDLIALIAVNNGIPLAVWATVKKNINDDLRRHLLRDFSASNLPREFIWKLLLSTLLPDNQIHIYLILAKSFVKLSMLQFYYEDNLIPLV